MHDEDPPGEYVPAGHKTQLPGALIPYPTMQFTTHDVEATVAV